MPDSDPYQLDAGYQSLLDDLLAFDKPVEITPNQLKSPEETIREAKDSLLDPTELIEKAIKADLDPSVFTEAEFPIAKNVVDWCINPSFLNEPLRPLPRQFQILVHFFRDACYFCSDTEYIHDVPVDASQGELLDRFRILEYGTCPDCQRNKQQIQEEWIVDPRFHKYNNFEETVNVRPVPPNEFVGIWGQRSGKSMMVATYVLPYILHRYLALPNPTKYFNIPGNTILGGVLVATKLDQIQEAMWDRFRFTYENSPWFREVKEYLLDEGKRKGLQLYREGQTFMSFTGKRLLLQMAAGHGGRLRGSTRFFCAIDELGWFNSTEDGKQRAGAQSGMAIYTALRNSLQTLRNKAEWRRRVKGDFDAIDGYMFNVSSPSSVNDPIMTLGYLAPKRPRVLFSHLPTWEVNPEYYKEVLLEEYAGRETEFRRDFEAVPPAAAKPFFEDESFEVLSSLIYKDSYIPHIFKCSTKIGEDALGSGRQYLRPTLVHVRPDRMTPRILTIDNGETKNSFAICVARYMPDRGGVLFEEMLEIAPYKGHVVDLAWCYNELIVKLVQNYQFLHVGYDRWESTYAINDLRTSYKTDAQKYSLKWRDFENFKEDLRAARLWFPEPEIEPSKVLQIRDLAMRARYPRSHLMVQTVTVNQFGKRVYKPDGGNDDLFRTAVLAHYFIKKHEKEYQQKSKFMLRNRRGPDAFQTKFVSKGAFSGGGRGRGRSGGGGNGRGGMLGGMGGMGRIGQ